MRLLVSTLVVLCFVFPASVLPRTMPAAEARGGAATGQQGKVPDVGGLHLAEARRRLEAAGFRIGRIEEYTPSQAQVIFDSWAWRDLVAKGVVTGPMADYSPEDVEAIFKEHGRPRQGTIDHVFQQSPRSGLPHGLGQLVDLRVCALRSGVRKGIPSRSADGRTGVGRSGRGDAPAPGRGEGPLAPTLTEPEADQNRAPGAARDPVPAPEGAEPEAGPADDNSEDDGAYASGSPEAPRVITQGRTDVVPSMLGLSLNDAEQLIADAEMTLHVDRIAGHPIGRVLEQAPSAGGRRPAGGVVRVVVTAGGDYDGEQGPIAPEVYLSKVVVPGLLDRTLLQAKRIIEDLGLRPREEKAKRGLPGRVVDQMPPAGGRVPKGGFVRIWIGPGETPAPPEPGARPARATAPNNSSSSDAAAPTAPAVPEGTGASTPVVNDSDPDAPVPPPLAPRRTPDPEVPAPKPPLDPGPLRLGVPEPVAPGHGTTLPRDASVPIGFTWRGVKGAEAYILEIEEEGAEGRWMPNARKPSKSTAVILDVERLSSRSSGRLRWRVTAISNGRPGKASKWVLLK